MFIKSSIWFGKELFHSLICGSGQLNSGDKFYINGLWKCNMDVCNLTGKKLFYYEGICDFTLCALYFKCMKCELG
jgi:hypothetical protein